MIESVLFFALGFLVAGLFALMIVPSIWRRAVRLTRLEIEASTPLSLAEIKANRDQMRAEFARETRRLELAMGELRRRAAERQIEASRSRDRIADLAAERDVLAGRLATVEGELHGRMAEFEAARSAMADARRHEEGQSGEITELKIRLADLVNEIEARKVESAALRTQIEALEARALHLTDERKQAVYRAEVAEAEVARRDAVSADEQDRIRRLDAALAERARDLTAKSDQLAKAQSRMSDLEQQIGKLKAALAAAEDLPTQMVGPGDNLARTIEGLERANADLEARIASLTADREASEAELTALRAAAGAPTDSAEIEVLRDKLAELAAQVVHLAGAADGGADRPNPAAAPVESASEAAPAPTPEAVPAPPEPTGSEAPSSPVSRRKRKGLTERIRALQEKAPDTASSGGP